MRLRSVRMELVLLLTTMGGSAVAPGEQTWTEIRSPHFRVLTDASASDGRSVANEFEQMRNVFAVRFGDGEDVRTGPPLTIVAARSEQTSRELEPRLWKAKGKSDPSAQFYSRWERQFASIRLDTWQGAQQVPVYYEYTQSFLHANVLWLPVWLEVGLGEFYSYTTFQHDRVLVGAPSLRSGTLKSMVLIPVSTMLRVHGRSPYLQDPIKIQEFYAQSWAMVHYMTFGQGMGNGDKLEQFVKLLQQETPQDKAFAQVFGDEKAFLDGLLQYVRQFSFKVSILPPDKKTDPRTFTERKLTPAETAYELGCFHVGTHDREGGRALLEKALALDPKLAGVHEELGYLDFDAGDDQAATEEWTRAVALDPSLPQATFALAMSGTSVSHQTPDQLRDTQARLRHVTELAPKFAPAFAELALVEWRLNSMQNAYKDARQAETLEPHRAGYRLLTGHILLQGNQPVLAATYARFVAEHWTGTDHNEAVELWQNVPPARRDSDPPPVLDMPPDTQIVRGTLTEVACRKEKGERTKFTIRPDSADGANLSTAQLLKLTGANQFRFGFSDTLWWGEDHFSLCHHVEGKNVVVAYKTDTNEVEAIEIRDDLPDDDATMGKKDKVDARGK